MNRKHTVTIGIPAYNEAASIGQLLESLLMQRLTTLDVERIIVYSDASTDTTDSIVEKYQPRVSLVRQRSRVGKPRLFCRMCREHTSDILIVLDADIMITQTDFLELLSAPIRLSKAQLTSAKVQHQAPKSDFERMLAFSMILKERVFTQYKSGSNIYTCHGRARAFSKELYKQLHMPVEVLAEDAYSFLFCQQSGGKYEYVPAAICTYRLPQTRLDHNKQSDRFFQGKSQLEQWFGHKYVTRAYSLPLKPLLSSMIAYFLHHPHLFLDYLVVVTCRKINNFRAAPMSTQWDMSQTTK